MLKFSKLIQAQFDAMCLTGKLFRVKMSGQEVWDLYLASFEPEQDPIFRDPASSTHNCNLCKNFIRRYGNIVAINADGTLMSIFDVVAEDEFTNVAQALSNAITKSTIVNVFFETFNELNSLNYEKCSMSNPVFRLGMDRNTKRYTAEEAAMYGVVTANQSITFNHLHLDVPTAFIDNSKKSIESIMGEYRDKYSVFKRAMLEIPVDTLHLVRDLIVQGSLLDGEAHLPALVKFTEYAIDYSKLDTTSAVKDNWFWKTTYDMHERIAKFKNTLIGVLCSEISEGEELNKACLSWNKRVDPANFMKATAPITEKQKQAAKKFVEDNGYVESFDRRVATMDDIMISEILHSNVGNDEVKTVSIFDSVKTVKTQHKRSQFDTVEEVTIEKFMSDILPTCTSVEAFLENRLSGNMVTMTTANNPDSKPMFKWPNNYSWSFNGNLAGKSQLKEAVVARGGRVDGVFRFSHSWNELEPNQSLMDLHVFMPGCELPKGTHHGPSVSGRRVGWNHRTDTMSGGTQDVDYTQAAPAGYIPVENITFPELARMPEGKYTCMINNWSFRYTGGRGKAEIAFGGESYQYEYPATRQDEWVTIAEVTLRNGMFTIEHKLPELASSIDLYGLETNNFYKVNLVCLSPNHWGDNAVGNKHYFFMLEGCKCPGEVRSFHSENFNAELHEHRKVLEGLGAVHMVPSLDKQLSGLGFNATVHDEVILRLAGSFKRVVKVKF